MVSSHLARGVGLAAFLFALGSLALSYAGAVGDTRTIALHHVHTGENLTITYKKNGKYDEEALKKINWIMRDWRKNQAIRIDPEEIDLLWEVYQEVDAKEPIHIICGYRSPETNAMLRRRSRGVARFSQHTLGKAIDFYIPGVPLDKLRATAMKIQGGGVGYYPASGSPFVHLDIGNVRAWPRMTRAQLVKLFPDGRTVHLPSDGKPLPGYQLALADLERGRHHQRRPTQPQKRTLLASLFGGSQEAEEADDNASASLNRAPKSAAAAKPERTAVAVASAPAIENVPLPRTRPIYQIASAESRPAPLLAAPVNVASLTPNQIINMRGYWEGLPETAPATEKSAHDLSEARRILASSLIAASSRDVTAAVGPFAGPDRVPPEIALAYAAQGSAAQPDSGRPRSTAVPMARQVSATPPAIVTSKSRASVAIKPAETTPQSHLAKTAARANDPWLRGLILTSGVRRAMTVTPFGDPDFARLTPYLHKPDASVVMTFSHDPHLGMSAEAFSGGAIVFQATVTFADRRTASLR